MAQYKSNIANGYQLLFNINVTSQSVTNNTSTVTWSLQISNGHTYYIARHTGNAVFGGVTLWSEPDATFNSSPSGAIKTITSGTRTYTHTSAGTLTVTLAAALRTITQGMSWSVPLLNLSGTFVFPTIARFATPPDRPTIFEYDHRLVRLTVPETTAPSGQTVTGYQVIKHDNFRGTSEIGQCDENRQHFFTPIKPETSYFFQARAATSAGWSDWSDPTARWTSMGSGPHIHHSGAFRYSHAFVNYSGDWLPALTWVKNAGIWEPVTK